MEPEIDFPRGGAGVLTALEIRDVKHQAKQDVLFKDEAEKVTTPKKTPKQAKSKKDTKRETPSSKRVILEEFPSLKKLTVGTLLLCAVREVKDYTLLVSLPFNIPATVHITDISIPFKNLAHQLAESVDNEEDDAVTRLPPLDRLFYPGMLLPCSVTSIQGKQVSVSIDPAVVNANVTASSIKQGMVLSAYIQSAEDHGYIVSFGLSSNKTGFLLNKNAQQFIREHNSGKPLKVGQVISCLVLPGANARSVPVTINPEKVHAALISATDHLLTINDIIPGLLVNATLKEVTTNGLIFTIFGVFEAHVSIRHFPNDDCNTDGFVVKKKYKARVLWVERTTVNIGLTLLPDIVKGSPQIPSMEIGHIIEKATIVHVESSNALMLNLGDGIRGYAPISMVSEERISKFGTHFSVGSNHRCRVVQFNYMDNAVVVSLQKSVLEKPFMTYNDITVGQQVTGTVMHREPYGMLVQLTDYIRGLCPALHLADSKLKHPGKKLKQGKPVDCRVLHVDADRKRLLLTHKKTLVESSLPLLADYGDAKPGGTHHGVVIAVKDFGCLVQFFNNIRGIVRKPELSSQFIPDPSSAFTVGQVVQCRVLECDPVNKKLSLTFKGDGKPEESSHLPGQITDAIVMAMLPEGLSLELLPSQEPAFLPLAHLSDHMELCPFLLDIHREQLEFATTSTPYKLSDVMIVCPKLPSRPILVTKKNSLMKMAENEDGFTLTFSDLQPGMILNGFIKKCLPYGCFVEFVNNLVALAPNKYLKDEFVSDGSTVYKEGQSVKGKVMELDREKQRFLVTLRCSDLQLSKESSSFSDWSKSLLSEFESYLKEREIVLESLPILKDKLSHFAPDSCVEGTVLQVKSDEQLLLLDLGDDVTGSAYCTNTEEYSEGDQINCCIMELRQDGTATVSISPDLLEAATKLKKNKKKRSSTADSSVFSKHRKLQLAELQSGNTVMVHVELVTSHYIMGTCTLLSGHVIVYGLFDTGQMKTFPVNMKFIKPGASVRATVCSPGTSFAGELVGPPVVMVTREKDKGSYTGSHDILNVKAGDIINVTVKNVQQLQIDIRAGIMRGRVHITQVLDKPLQDLTKSPFSKYGSGDLVKARVIMLRDRPVTDLGSKSGASTQLLELSIKPSVMAAKGVTDFTYLLNPPLSVGCSIDGFVKMVAKTHLVVCLTPSLIGEVPTVLTSTDPEVLANPNLYFSIGQCVHCTVVKVDDKLSLLSLIGDCEEPSVGDIVTGQVRKIISDECALVSFGAGLLGRVDITDTSDDYSDDPFSQSTTYSIVKCCVVGMGDGRVDLSLRESRLGEEHGDIKDPEITTISDLKVGKIVRGYVKSKTNVGYFIRLGRHVTGRVKIGNITDKYVKDFKSLYRVGALVTAKVIGLTELEQKIELSLRQSDVNSKSKKKARQLRKRSNASKGELDLAKKKRKTVELVTEEESEEEEEEIVYSSSESVESPEEEDDEITIQPQHPRLATRVGFNWETSDSVTVNHSSSDSSDESELMDDNVEVSAKKRTKRQKRADKLAEERRLFETEQALLDVDRAPQGPEDFDRLLMNAPNDSLLWMHYMAFYIHTTEIDKAQAVGQRALQTISFREEKEKLNIWVALLNLENLYGTQEALLKVFDEALRQNEPIDVFFKLITIYQNSEKYELAEQLYQTMTKRFKDTASVWTRYGLFLMKQGRPDAARKVLEKSLKTVNKKQYVNVIVKFSQYEFQYGDAERGKTMFESVLRNYPKRVDVWSVYIDLLIKQEDFNHVRELFERAVHLKLSSKRMKFFFKRYLAFEEQYGNEATVLAVKEKALAYVKSVT